MFVINWHEEVRRAKEALGPRWADRAREHLAKAEGWRELLRHPARELSLGQKIDQADSAWALGYSEGAWALAIAKRPGALRPPEPGSRRARRAWRRAIEEVYAPDTPPRIPYPADTREAAFLAGYREALKDWRRDPFNPDAG